MRRLGVSVMQCSGRTPDAASSPATATRAWPACRRAADPRAFVNADLGEAAGLVAEHIAPCGPTSS